MHTRKKKHLITYKVIINNSFVLVPKFAAIWLAAGVYPSNSGIHSAYLEIGQTRVFIHPARQAHLLWPHTHGDMLHYIIPWGMSTPKSLLPYAPLHMLFEIELNQQMHDILKMLLWLIRSSVAGFHWPIWKQPAVGLLNGELPHVNSRPLLIHQVKYLEINICPRVS